MIRSEPHRYSDGQDTFIGKIVRDDSAAGPQPGILVVPSFMGLGSFEEDRGKELAALGYAVLAVDYYGDGKRAADDAEATALMGALDKDRPAIARRMTAALEALKALDAVDADRTGAVGYCFGGKCALDLARTGAAMQAVATFHGVYDAPDDKAARIVPAALILHGWDDPLSPPDAVTKLASELTETCEDWQILAFGHTGHAFTNPNAKAPDKGMAFNETARNRGWRVLTTFLGEKLKPSAVGQP